MNKSQTPFKEGYQAFRQGDLNNPYNHEPARGKEWQYGFDRAYFNNLSWVKKKEAERGSTQKKAPAN